MRGQAAYRNHRRQWASIAVCAAVTCVVLAVVAALLGGTHRAPVGVGAMACAGVAAALFGYAWGESEEEEALDGSRPSSGDAPPAGCTDGVAPADNGRLGSYEDRVRYQR